MLCKLLFRPSNGLENIQNPPFRAENGQHLAQINDFAKVWGGGKYLPEKIDNHLDIVLILCVRIK